MRLSGSVALVTGATGFVGSNLVRRLLGEAAAVHVIARASSDTWRLDDLRSKLHWHTGDLVDRDQVSRIVRGVRPDVIFHLAKHVGDPVAMDYAAAYRNNVGATLALLDAARESPVMRFVHAGSSLEYDVSQSPLREDAVGVPLSVHGVTKLAASSLVQHFAARHRVPAVVLRLFTVYGPWEGPKRFVPRAVMAALDHLALSVTNPALRLSHDWIHVDDVVGACVASLASDEAVGEVINVATGSRTTNDDVLALVERAAGTTVTRHADEFPPRAWDSNVWVADVSKARERLGWSASIDLARGLQETVEWFRAHRALYPAPAAGAR